MPERERKRIFVLDDSPARMEWFYTEFFDDVVIGTNDATAAQHLLRSIHFDLICLDHDLGGKAFVSSSDPNTGFQVVKALPGSPNSASSVVIHSLNGEGAKRMEAFLKEHKEFTGGVTRAPFGTWKRV